MVMVDIHNCTRELAWEKIYDLTFICLLSKSTTGKCTNSSCLFFSFISLLRWLLEVSFSLLIFFLGYVHSPSPQWSMSIYFVFCCSSITSFQTFNFLYKYRSFKVLQSSFSIVHISHQNNDEWENLPLVLLNNKQMKDKS